MRTKQPKGGRERRRFPRKDAQVKVKLMARRDQNVAFEATLPAENVSLGGLFLQSQFFLKPGLELEIEFELADLGEIIRCRGVVVREERSSILRHRSGFAIRFTEYLGDAKLAIANFFLAPEVHQFVETYLKSGRPSRLRSEVARLVDLVVAWELAHIEEELED